MADIIKKYGDKIKNAASIIGAIFFLQAVLGGFLYTLFYPADKGESLETKFSNLEIRVVTIEEEKIADGVIALSKERTAACESDNMDLAKHIQLQIEVARKTEPTGGTGCEIN